MPFAAHLELWKEPRPKTQKHLNPTYRIHPPFFT